MFTGLVEFMGRVTGLTPGGGGVRLTLSEERLAREASLGESVAVNGTCLTVVDREGANVSFQLGPETLERTNLGSLSVGDRVNLERALRVGDRLGGHWVQGHVDGVGTIARRDRHDDWEITWFGCPPALTAFMISKGSIAVDGVSLTLVEVQSDGFSVMLIPHTLANTTLGHKPLGAEVNLETDVLAKYVSKLLAPRTS